MVDLKSFCKITRAIVFFDLDLLPGGWCRSQVSVQMCTSTPELDPDRTELDRCPVIHCPVLVVQMPLWTLATVFISCTFLKGSHARVRSV